VYYQSPRKLRGRNIAKEYVGLDRKLLGRKSTIVLILDSEQEEIQIDIEKVFFEESNPFCVMYHNNSEGDTYFEFLLAASNIQRHCLLNAVLSRSKRVYKL